MRILQVPELASHGRPTLRLLLVTFDPPENVGGIEGRVEGYAKELPKRGVQVGILSLARDYDRDEGRFHGVPIHRTSSRPGRVLGSSSTFIRMAAAGRYDTVFLLSGATTLMGNAFLLCSRLIRVRSGVLFYGKDILQARKGVMGRLLLFSSLLLSNRVLANSRFTASLLPKFASARAAILYPTVNPDVATPPEAGHARGHDVLFVGRLVKRKGVGDLIDAFSIVESTDPDCHLDIVGDGPERQNLENIVTDLGLTAKVTFHGSLRGEALYSRYRACDVVVMPSTRTSDDAEGFGTVFLEAALFSKPSVGTVSGGIPEAIADGLSGVLVPESDVPKLARAIAALLEGGELRGRLGRNARARTLRSFTWAKSAQVLTEALRK